MNTKFRFAYLLLTISLLSGCGMAGLPFTGQVMDAETGEPIEGVIVVALWKGEVNPIVDSMQICYHVETAVSNENGKYRMPGWTGGHWGVMGSYIVTEAYKKGYERVPVNNRYTKDEIKMVHFSGTNTQWLEYLDKYVSRASCLGGGRSRKKLFAFYKRIYEDADDISGSREKRIVVDRIRNAAASAGVAAPLDMNSRQAEELEQKFIEEYMK